MGISMMTAMTLKHNSEIKIMVGGEKKPYAAYIYIMHDGEIHSLLVSTNPVFQTKKLAKQAMSDLIKKCKESKDI